MGRQGDPGAPAAGNANRANVRSRTRRFQTENIVRHGFAIAAAHVCNVHRSNLGFQIIFTNGDLTCPRIAYLDPIRFSRTETFHPPFPSIFRMQSPIVSILNIGDELLLGLRDNSDLLYIGETLAREGLPVACASIARDNREQLATTFGLLWERSDILITTGGLGPTSDDNTREAVAQALGLPLVRVQELADKIDAFMAARGRKTTENNYKQANLIKGAEIIPNPNGTACGQWLQIGKRILVMLPGPPSELVPMVSDWLMPRLRELGLAQPGQPWIHICTSGIGESALETKISDLLAPWMDKALVAYAVKDNGMVDMRLSPIKGRSTLDEVKGLARAIRTRLENDFVSFGDCCLARTIIEHMTALGQRIAVAESCTGGMVADAFVRIPGASKAFSGGIIAYTVKSKHDALGIPEDIILQHGEVSAEVAASMAMGICDQLGTEFGISVTGYAGPTGGTPDAPVGTVYVGFASPSGVWSHRYHFSGTREAIRQRALVAALDFARRKLIKFAVDNVIHVMGCGELE